jgi:type VI protein secretion system component VasK
MSEVEEAKTYTEDEYNSVKGKLDEFRGNNVKLMKDMETLNTKFDGIDVDSYNDMLKNQQAQKDKKLIDAGKIEELFAEREKGLKTAQDKELQAKEAEIQTLNTQLATLVIDNAVRDSAAKAGVVDTGIDDVLLRSQSVFTLNDGKAVPHDTNGNVIYGEGTSEPMSVAEWVKGQMAIAPHLFKASSGSGSEHGKNFVGGGTSDMSPLEKLSAGFARK